MRANPRRPRRGGPALGGGRAPSPRASPIQQRKKRTHTTGKGRGRTFWSSSVGGGVAAGSAGNARQPA